MSPSCWLSSASPPTWTEEMAQSGITVNLQNPENPSRQRSDTSSGSGWLHTAVYSAIFGERCVCSSRTRCCCEVAGLSRLGLVSGTSSLAATAATPERTAPTRHGSRAGKVSPVKPYVYPPSPGPIRLITPPAPITAAELRAADGHQGHPAVAHSEQHKAGSSPSARGTAGGRSGPSPGPIASRRGCAQRAGTCPARPRRRPCGRGRWPSQDRRPGSRRKKRRRRSSSSALRSRGTAQRRRRCRRGRSAAPTLASAPSGACSSGCRCCCTCVARTWARVLVLELARTSLASSAPPPPPPPARSSVRTRTDRRRRTAQPDQHSAVLGIPTTSPTRFTQTRARPPTRA
eukprot:1991346-Prymnesium_polylepis.2